MLEFLVCKGAILSLSQDSNILHGTHTKLIPYSSGRFQCWAYGSMGRCGAQTLTKTQVQSSSSLGHYITVRSTIITNWTYESRKGRNSFPLTLGYHNPQVMINMKRYSCFGLSQFLKNIYQISKMAQWLKVIANKPDDPSSIPGTHVRRREMTSTNCSLTSTHMPWHEHKHIHAHTHACTYTHAHKIYKSEQKILIFAIT